MNQQQFVTQLLHVLQTLTFEDMSKIQDDQQHIVAERIGQLPDVARAMKDNEGEAVH